jgi:hypothetical protein
VKKSGYRIPCPGKLPANGVKPWMYLFFHLWEVWVRRYWM